MVVCLQTTLIGADIGLLLWPSVRYHPAIVEYIIIYD